MLVAIPPGKTPSKEELLDGACQNPDGFGYAIIGNDKKIISNRTMKAEDSIDEFLKVRAQNPNGEAMWHCRIATHGVKTVENCHPFQIGGDPLTYLGHNGILGVKPDEGDTRSDTAIFAQDILPTVGGVRALDNAFMFHLLESWMSGSKVVVLTVNPKAKKTMYILNEKLGTEDKDGIWWSNTNHRGARARKTSTQNYPTYGYDSHLTKRWNPNTRRREDILGIFRQGEYKPLGCAESHPLNDDRKPSYCYLCTARFDKNLKQIGSDPHSIWLMTRSADKYQEVAYILLDKDELNMQAQTSKYFHTLTEDCLTIGLKTKWAYCFRHDSPWNDVHGRTPAKHSVKGGCKITAPNSAYPYCTTHSVSIDSEGVVRDPKVPAYETARSTPHLHLAGAGSGTTKKQVTWHEAGISDWDDPDVELVCATCKKVVDWEYAFREAKCSNCKHCFECDSSDGVCLCWTPTNKKSAPKEDAGF